MQSSETIQYDEFMDDGIPDTLLKALGYSEGERPDQDEGSANEIEGSCDEVDEIVKDHGNSSASTGSGEFGKHSVNVDSTPSYGDSVPSVKSKPRSGRIPKKTTIRGNIIYERTETGEIIASLLKNGDGRVANSPASSSAVQKSHKSRPRKTFHASPVEFDLPSNCPITEENVEDILDQSIQATYEMRQNLMALKDDLRRMGGGATVTPQLKPVYMLRRREIANRLTNVYVDYQVAIDEICNVSEGLMDVLVSPVPQKAKSPVVQTPLPTTDAVPSTSTKRRKKKQVAIKQEEITPTGSDREETGTILEDLWMSCEPGDEYVLPTSSQGDAKKRRRQRRSKTLQAADFAE